MMGFWKGFLCILLRDFQGSTLMCKHKVMIFEETTNLMCHLQISERNVSSKVVL